MTSVVRLRLRLQLFALPKTKNCIILDVFYCCYLYILKTTGTFFNLFRVCKDFFEYVSLQFDCNVICNWSSVYVWCNLGALAFADTMAINRPDILVTADTIPIKSLMLFTCKLVIMIIIKILYFHLLTDFENVADIHKSRCIRIKCR